MSLLLGGRTIFRLGSCALALGLVGTVGGVALPAAASAASSSAPGVTKTSITIGDIAALTGPFGSEFVEVNQAFMAAIDAQNAKGGVDGRKIKVVTEDDQSSPSADLTAAQSLVEAKGVFMIAFNTSLANGASSYLVANNIPAFQDGDNPALGSLPNFFIADGAISPNPNVAATTTGLIFKKIGATKIGALAQSISSAAGAAASETIASAKAAGLQAGYLNTTLPATIADWTPYVLGVKSSGTDGVNPALTPQDSLDFLTAANQQGLHLKLLLDTGYNFDFLTNPTTEPLMQGAYVLSHFVPSELNTAGTKAEDAALKKYGHFTEPADFVSSLGYGVGVLAIRALQAAGPNPTRAGLIKNMRAVTGYTANGLLPVPVNFANALKPAFQPPNQVAYGNCQYVLKVVGKNFVPLSTKPVCGKLFKSS
jgi:branched-chain amino acid transport system substrate-binding protein